MTARASAAFCSSPAPPIAIGIMPTIIAAAVISTGRIRVWPASMAASNAGLAGELLLAREGDEQDRVRRGDADRHDRAHQRGNVERRAGDEQHRRGCRRRSPAAPAGRRTDRRNSGSSPPSAGTRTPRRTGCRCRGRGNCRSMLWIWPSDLDVIARLELRLTARRRSCRSRPPRCRDRAPCTLA